MTMPPGEMNRPLGVYSTFLPAREAQLAMNGQAAKGAVILSDRFGLTGIELLPRLVGDLDEAQGVSNLK